MKNYVIAFSIRADSLVVGKDARLVREFLRNWPHHLSTLSKKECYEYYYYKGHGWSSNASNADGLGSNPQ